MSNTATRDSRDESGKMLPAKHCICDIRHKATSCQTHLFFAPHNRLCKMKKSAYLVLSCFMGGFQNKAQGIFYKCHIDGGSKRSIITDFQLPCCVKMHDFLLRIKILSRHTKQYLNCVLYFQNFVKLH